VVGDHSGEGILKGDDYRLFFALIMNGAVKPVMVRLDFNTFSD